VQENAVARVRKDRVSEGEDRLSDESEGDRAQEEFSAGIDREMKPAGGREMIATGPEKSTARGETSENLKEDRAAKNPPPKKKHREKDLP